MAFLCAMMGHTATTARHHNQGLDFSICHHCGCDLIRSADEGEWTEVPKGFRIVWREFGRSGDAASVATRMARMAPPPRRRDPRNARPKPRRDPRGRPLRGAASVAGMLANLGRLIASEPDEDGPAIESNGQYVICLPSAGGR